MHLHPSLARALCVETQAEHLRRAERARLSAASRPAPRLFRRRRLRPREAPVGAPVLRVVRP